MKKLLYLTLVFAGLMTNAQTNLTTGNCNAMFTSYQTSYDSILSIASFQLTNLSKGDSLKYLWQFDNGKTSTEKEPVISFDLKQPEHKVCLTVTGTNKSTDTFCDAVYILNPNKPIPADPKPVECITSVGYAINFQIKTLVPAMVLNFYSKASPEATEWKWDFGDGTSATEANPTHIFNLPLVNIDSAGKNPDLIRKVCLTVKTTSGCIATSCESIAISGKKPDTSYVSLPVCNYTMHVKSGFPIQMSSCTGVAKAQVYLKDAVIKVDNYFWSTGAESQEVRNLCPTQTYTVKAKTSDGCFVSSSFVFNSDGTITDLPINWWLTGKQEDQIVKYDLNNKDYTVEWKLCDGTIMKGDSIPLNLINCGTKESNLILKDASGKIVYTENISQKSVISDINVVKKTSSVKLYPNPVTDLLNIQYSGNMLNELRIEIYDNSGKRISQQKVYDVESGQQISLNVNLFRKGFYICKMVSGNSIIGIQKFSK